MNNSYFVLHAASYRLFYLSSKDANVLFSEVDRNRTHKTQHNRQIETNCLTGIILSHRWRSRGARFKKFPISKRAVQKIPNLEARCSKNNTKTRGALFKKCQKSRRAVQSKKISQSHLLVRIATLFLIMRPKLYRIPTGNSEDKSWIGPCHLLARIFNCIG
jgi:hypothetical protein